MASKVLLIVDDEPVNLVLLTHLLEPEYQVRAANSGADALRAAVSEPLPDLILLDVMMPDMDGFTVLTKLREDPASRGIPVIFVTAMDAIEYERKGLELGAVDYITKPFSPPIVLARVHTHLEYQRVDALQRELQCTCLLYTSPSPRDGLLSRMPSSA